MPSSNTPSDLKTVIIRALDAACTNASDENSNGCLSRSFANIKELPRLLFQCATLATPRCDPVGKTAALLGVSAAFFIFAISVRSFSKVNR
jgi:hypothetical protein